MESDFTNPVYCPQCRRQVSADADYCPHCGAAVSVEARRREATAGQPPPGQPRSAQQSAQWRIWLWVPPLRGVVRYPVLRMYQYICMVFAWLQLGWACLCFVVASIAVVSTIDENDQSGFMVLLALLLIPIVAAFIFLSLRALVEGIQVYLDIEDNTRATAARLGDATDRGEPGE